MCFNFLSAFGCDALSKSLCEWGLLWFWNIRALKRLFFLFAYRKKLQVLGHCSSACNVFNTFRKWKLLLFAVNYYCCPQMPEALYRPKHSAVHIVNIYECSFSFMLSCNSEHPLEELINLDNKRTTVISCTVTRELFSAKGCAKVWLLYVALWLREQLAGF